MLPPPTAHLDVQDADQQGHDGKAIQLKAVALQQGRGEAERACQCQRAEAGVRQEGVALRQVTADPRPCAWKLPGCLACRPSCRARTR